MRNTEEFEKLINDTNCTESKIQKFLELNTDFIPKKFMENHGISGNVIISKLKLGTQYETDFAFVSKCTNYWNVVLIEIEKPCKKIFTTSNDFTAEFTHAKGQILNWKSLICQDSSLKNNLVKSLDNLFFPMEMKNNPINIKYVLVYGRSEEINNEERKRLFNLENNQNPDIAIVTYDRLKTRWENQCYSNCIIANIQQGNKLAIKYIPDIDFDTSLFAYVSPSKIIIKDEDINKLKNYGYEMDEWKKDFRLKINNKKADLQEIGGFNTKTIFSKEKFSY